MSTTDTPAPTGPFKWVTTRSYKVTGLELTVTESTESTHPPQPCGCQDEDDGDSEYNHQYTHSLLKALIEMAAKLVPPPPPGT